MSLALLLIVYCVLVVAASLLGGWLPSLIELTHTRMQLMMSLVSGLMLGIALLHMLPQAAAQLPSMTQVAGGMLAGLLVMFFLLRLFHVHMHGELDDECCADECYADECCGDERCVDECCDDHCHHDHPGDASDADNNAGDNSADEQAAAACCDDDDCDCDAHAGHELNWLGLYIGLAIHTLLDGVALAASAVADAQHHAATAALFGLGTFLAVLLHKPLDALAITSLMRIGGWSLKSQTLANLGYAMMCPLGAAAFWFGVSRATGEQSAVVGYALAFSAGFFLCIALGDLLPEVQFHSHDRWKLSGALLAGVALAVGIELTHSHDHEPVQQPGHGHEHAAHDHDHS